MVGPTRDTVAGMQRFSSVVLVDDRGWVLLQERDEFPEIDPEKWGFVGGHLDAGEDYHTHSDSDDEFSLFVMRTHLTDADIDCREGRQIVFVDPERLIDLDLTASARVALPQFLSSASYAAMS